MLASRSLIRHSPRHAMVAVQVAVCLSVLMTVFALALDRGVCLAERRHAQATADAAALAAATDLYSYYPVNNGADTGGTARNSALTTASANGYPIVTVNIPPKAGSFIDKAGYAEVIVPNNQPSILSGFLGPAQTLRTPLPRAVARGAWPQDSDALPFNAGLFLSYPESTNPLSGTGSLTVQNGGIIINSEGATVGPNITTTPPTPPRIADRSNNVFPIFDPLAYLPAKSSIELTAGRWEPPYLYPGIFGALGVPPPHFTSGDTVIFKQKTAGNGGIYYLAAGGFTSDGANLLMDPDSSGGIMFYNAGTGPGDGFNIDLGKFELPPSLMPWGDGSGMPTSGISLVIVGIDNNDLLHIRIFGAGGNLVTDTDETKLPSRQATAISTLKQQLPGLLSPHVLTDAEKDQVITQVTSILGPTISPPTSGNYQGILYFQARDTTTQAGLTLAGKDSFFNITGTFYAPSASVTLTGNGSPTNAPTFGSQFIVKGMTLNGSGTALINYPTDPKILDVSVGKTRIISLVE